MELINIMSNNFHFVTIKNITLYFSYEALIAVRRKDTLLISKNEWSKTTDKHINYLKETNKNYIEVNHEEVLEFANSLF